MSQGNWRTQQIFEQLGGTGLRGAFAYTGARSITYKERPDDSMPAESIYDDNGYLTYEIGIQFKPNLNINSRFIITLEPSDTYTIRFVKILPIGNKSGKATKMLTVIGDVYCDQLQELVEQTYDQYVKEHQGGFIKI